MKVAIIGKGIMGKQIYNYLNGFVTTSILSHNDDFNEIKDYDIIIESIIEDINAKRILFEKLNNICSKNTIFASNTSSLSINDMTINDRSVIGLHFMNPVNRIDTIELIYPTHINNLTILRITNFLDKINKKYFTVSDTKGFVVNKLLITLIHEALKMCDHEKPETIDALMVNCCKFPIGPLKLGDIIGWDVIMNICKNIDIEPCNKLKELIYHRHLGKKENKGIYEYNKNKSEKKNIVSNFSNFKL